jgi:hypothetical protein
MSKKPSIGNRSLTDWFKPKGTASQPSERSAQTFDTAPQKRISSPQKTVPALERSEPPSKRPRIDSEGKWPLASPTPSPATLIESAEQPQPSKQPLTDINASFSSMQSTGSKRLITSSGQQVVRGSDTETDEDLEDLDTILNKSKPKPKPASSASNSLPAVPVLKKQPQKNYAFSLSRLVEEKRRQTAMEVRIAEAQANSHEASIEATAWHGSPKKEAIKAVLMESNNTEDPGKARRVMDALARTDAFERNDVWHFFESLPRTRPSNPFPRISHSNGMLQMTLNDPERRRQAFTSGYIQRIAEKMPLPDELLTWLMAEVCRETKDVLLSAYIETLQHALSSTSSCLSPENLMIRFRALGVKPDAMDFESPIRHNRETTNARAKSISSNISALFDLLSRICEQLPLASKDLVVHFLVRACFDQTVLADASLRLRIETCLTNLLHAYDDDDEFPQALTRLTKAIFNSVSPATLRQQILSALPKSTFKTHQFRRRLALAFALDKARHLDADLYNPALTARMLLLFEKGSALRITSETDYVELRARLGMLDVALDAGFTDFAFLVDEDKQAEKQFNENIDRLTNAVRDMTARIVDAGAAHMSRTEAKVMAERLAQRLEFAVRTKEKPPKDWFGEHERTAMKKWVIKKEGVLDKKDDLALVETDTPEVNSEQPSSEEDKFNANATQPNPPEGGTAPKQVERTTTPSTDEKKMVIRSSTVTPIAKKGKNRMMMMKF